MNIFAIVATLVAIYIITSVIKVFEVEHRTPHVTNKVNDTTMEENKEKRQNEIMITEDGIQAEIGTRDLLMHVLMEMGCQYTVDEDDMICFAYQGEVFRVVADNECQFINVFNTFWEGCELYDVEKVARLKRAINEVNLSKTVTVCYTIDEAENMMWVHCKTRFPFIPQIPDLVDYLKFIFAALFQAHHALGAEIERL